MAKYLRRGGPLRAPDPKQRWFTFVHNHAKVIVACDFFVVITATFRTLYVFVLMEVGTRRILHHNVTAHPTAEWTLQQFRETLPGDHAYRFVLHDRDSIFSRELDKAVTRLGVRVLRTPVGAPTANAYCERLGGSLRRECLDFLIPLNDGHLRMIVREWGLHYNRGRPHSSLGPGVPDQSQQSVPASDHRHKLPAGYRVGRTPGPWRLTSRVSPSQRGGLNDVAGASNGIFADHNGSKKPKDLFVMGLEWSQWDYEGQRTIQRGTDTIKRRDGIGYGWGARSHQRK